MSKHKRESYIDLSGHHVSYRESDGARLVQLVDFDPSRTEQAHKDECDLNFIVNQHVRSGQPIQIPESVFQDFSNLPDYHTAVNTVRGIDNLFKELPIAVKLAFDHNPELFMAAVEDPSRRDDLVALGVFKAKDGPISPVIPDVVAVDPTL